MQRNWRKVSSCCYLPNWLVMQIRFRPTNQSLLLFNSSSYRTNPSYTAADNKHKFRSAISSVSETISFRASIFLWNLVIKSAHKFIFCQYTAGLLLNGWRRRCWFTNKRAIALQISAQKSRTPSVAKWDSRPSRRLSGWMRTVADREPV